MALYFTKDCKDEHNYGSLELSQCELTNRSLEPSTGVNNITFNYIVNSKTYPTFVFDKASPLDNDQIIVSKLQKSVLEEIKNKSDRDGFRHEPFRYHGSNHLKYEVIGLSSFKDYNRQFSDIFNQRCEKWRGQKPSLKGRIYFEIQSASGDINHID